MAEPTQHSTRPTRQPNSHGCFICGLANPVGLKMVFEEDRERGQVRAEIVVPEHYRSYPGIVHGGIIATILDETSGRAIMMQTDDPNTFFATAKLSVRYRQPTPTNTPLIAIGWVEQMGEDRARVRGELRLQDGADGENPTVLAECESLIVKPRPGFLSGWGQEAPYWRTYSDQELAQARQNDSA